MKFLTELINRMFWFAVPLAFAIPLTVVMFFLWGLRVAAIFEYTVIMFVFTYALILMVYGTVTGNHKRARRLMSSDPFVERIVRRVTH
jgi:hypothetical protein